MSNPIANLLYLDIWDLLHPGEELHPLYIPSNDDLARLHSLADEVDPTIRERSRQLLEAVSAGNPILPIIARPSKKPLRTKLDHYRFVLANKHRLPSFLKVDEEIHELKKADFDKIWDTAMVDGVSLRNFLSGISDELKPFDGTKIGCQIRQSRLSIGDYFKIIDALKEPEIFQIISKMMKIPKNFKSVFIRSNMTDEKDSENNREGFYESIIEIRKRKISCLRNFILLNLLINPDVEMGGFVVSRKGQMSLHCYGNYENKIIVKLTIFGNSQGVLVIDRNSPENFDFHGLGVNFLGMNGLAEISLKVSEINNALFELYGEFTHFELGVDLEDNEDNIVKCRDYHYFQSRPLAPIIDTNYFPLQDECDYQCVFSGMSKLSPEGREGYIYWYPNEKAEKAASKIADVDPNGILLLKGDNDKTKAVEALTFRNWRNPLVLTSNGFVILTAHLSIAPHIPVIANTPGFHHQVSWIQREDGSLVSRDRWHVQFNGLETRLKKMRASRRNALARRS